MNPGKFVDPYRMDENLRWVPTTALEPETHFQWPKITAVLPMLHCVAWESGSAAGKMGEGGRRYHVPQLHGHP